jgi:hypothetical protein
MQLLKTLPARGPRLSWERYQQHVGTAAVLGGQLTLLRDGTARAVAVIGRRSLGIVPANTVRLTPEQAAGLATREIRGGTAVAALLIDPRSGRYSLPRGDAARVRALVPLDRRGDGQRPAQVRRARDR